MQVNNKNSLPYVRMRGAFLRRLILWKNFESLAIKLLFQHYLFCA